ncbi:hypothetical protein TELCIR_11990 [Teladorsagia circumcincta]|uniref:Uncharacterized protein n=1 Tax=Teladorsagia circumcincta TaxID=45464 RepID=A0A2G9U9Y0_TELCI|nr:hypothetical protein TELCIR_11990 [Teladorsagia circumcincta]
MIDVTEKDGTKDGKTSGDEVGAEAKAEIDIQIETENEAKYENEKSISRLETARHAHPHLQHGFESD